MSFCLLTQEELVFVEDVYRSQERQTLPFLFVGTAAQTQSCGPVLPVCGVVCVSTYVYMCENESEGQDVFLLFGQCYLSLRTSKSLTSSTPTPKQFAKAKIKQSLQFHTVDVHKTALNTMYLHIFHKCYG